MRVRGFLTGYLLLVALSALVGEGGSKRASGLLGTLTSLVERALSPAVAAIPDYSAGGTSAAAGGGSGSTLTGTAKGPNPDAPLGKSSTILPGTRPVIGGGGTRTAL